LRPPPTLMGLSLSLRSPVPHSSTATSSLAAVWSCSTLLRCGRCKAAGAPRRGRSSCRSVLSEIVTPPAPSRTAA
jgi:hypothetical protein